MSYIIGLSPLSSPSPLSPLIFSFSTQASRSHTRIMGTRCAPSDKQGLRALTCRVMYTERAYRRCTTDPGAKCILYVRGFFVTSLRRGVIPQRASLARDRTNWSRECKHEVTWCNETEKRELLTRFISTL